MARRLGTRAISFGAAAVLFIGAGVAELISTRSSSGKAPRVTHVEFIVTGSAPKGVDIQYGDDTSNYQGSLRRGVTKPIQKNTVYWVMAQLHGRGRITCKVILGNAVAAGHAIGGDKPTTPPPPRNPPA